MCQPEKPQANEVTEPLAFTVCKVELRWKAIVLQSLVTLLSSAFFAPIIFFLTDC